MDNHCGPGSLPLRYKSEPFQASFINNTIKVQCGKGDEVLLVLGGGVGVVEEGSPQSPSVRWVRGSDIGLNRPAIRINHEEGRRRIRGAWIKPINIQISRETRSNEFTLCRSLCPGKKILESLELEAASPTRGRERTRELEEPRQRYRSRSIKSRTCPNTNRKNTSWIRFFERRTRKTWCRSSIQ